MSTIRNYSSLKFLEWASGQRRFLVSIPEDDKPRSVDAALFFDEITVKPFFPASIEFSGGGGRLNLRYVTAIDKLSENTFLLHCGRKELAGLYRQVMVTTD